MALVAGFPASLPLGFRPNCQWEACRCLKHPPRPLSALVSAFSSALDAVHVCHQVFGAIGITLEGPAFHVSRRIRQLASSPGDAVAREVVLAHFERAGGAP